MCVFPFADADGALLVFSVVDRESFDAIPRWQEKVEEECGKIPMMLVQNKTDLTDSSAMGECVCH